MALNKLFEGEQCLIQTVDKRIMLTTHRLMKFSFSWVLPKKSDAVLLEDIVTWEVKPTGQSLYLGLSIAFASAIYFNNAFALLSGFFLILYIVTRHRKIHIRTHDSIMVLPLEELEDNSMKVLLDSVRMAQHNRIEQLKDTKPLTV